jgi:hypothetical protein
LPEVFVDYEENPREYNLCAVTTVVDIHSRVSDLYSVPHNQIAQQLRLTIEAIKEQQESELINSPSYGLLSNVTPSQTISTRTGSPPRRMTSTNSSRRSGRNPASSWRIPRRSRRSGGSAPAAACRHPR